MERLFTSLPRIVRPAVVVIRTTAESISVAYARERRKSRRNHGGSVIAIMRLVFSLRNLLIGLWLVTLWWGERKVFRDAVADCQWGRWEDWPNDAVPHHTLLIADPQLVDAHTYTGRPWPLSSLTVYLTDLYLYRTHSLLQKRLRPDSTLFLGDLFDGGREWGTSASTSPDERYKGYGNDVWMKEYKRFSRIYLDTFKLGGTGSPASTRGRKIIASLPGNHDLGFGNGIQLPVLQRFRTYFGEGNRIDILGNHTFASVDSVSLSAMDQVDPKTGNPIVQGPELEEIWKPVEVFLNDFQTLKSRAIQEELSVLNGNPESYVSRHAVSDAAQATKPSITPPAAGAHFPTIVLTHVPLFREAGTPCGPLREHWPPSSTNPPPEKDDRNAIRIGWGYQYQNVLTPKISEDIVNKTGPVIQVYSGDDHDYCEITHREFDPAPKEITVKSTSFAMSVRRPGVQLASLWNPIDPQTGKSLVSASSKTLQNKLCLLPDQIAVFIQYVYVLVFTILILLIHSVALTVRSPDTSDTSETILPLTHRFVDDTPISSASSTSGSASSLLNGENFNNRYGNGIVSRTATSSPSNDGARSTRHMLARSRQDDWDVSDKVREKSRSSSRDPVCEDLASRSRCSLFVFRMHFISRLKWIAGVALSWYFWLLWTW